METLRAELVDRMLLLLGRFNPAAGIARRCANPERANPLKPTFLPAQCHLNRVADAPAKVRGERTQFRMITSEATSPLRIRARDRCPRLAMLDTLWRGMNNAASQCSSRRFPST